MPSDYDSLKFGDFVEHDGWLNEGAKFIYIGCDEVPDTPWAYVLCVEGDLNNFDRGRIFKAHMSLVTVAEPEF